MMGSRIALEQALARDWGSLVGAPAALTNYVRNARAALLPKVGDERSDEDGWWMIIERHDDVEDGPVFVLCDKHGAERVVDAAKIGTGWRTP